MLLTVKEVATRLNLSERSVQAKCRQFKIPKISNQYQLNEDVIQNWGVKPQTNETAPHRTSKTAAVQNRTSTMLLVGVVTFLLSVIVCFFLYEISRNHKTIDGLVIQVNSLTTKSEKAKDTIYILKNKNYILEYENTDLRKKDSIRLIKKL